MVAKRDAIEAAQFQQRLKWKEIGPSETIPIKRIRSDLEKARTKKRVGSGKIPKIRWLILKKVLTKN